MKLKDMFRAIREYPAVCARLAVTCQELAQAKDDLTEGSREYNCLLKTAQSQERRLKVSQQRAEAALSAFQTFCPQMSSLEEMKRLYQSAAPSMDPQGFMLYRTARQLTGIDIHTLFSYEENRGLFTEADGHLLLRYLTAARFGAIAWTVVPGTCCESTALLDVDTSTSEYCAFEQQLYRRVLERMGFQGVLTPEQERALPKAKDMRQDRGDQNER